MHRNILVFHFIVAYALCPSTSFAHSILVKCSDAGGAITYMSDQCGEDLSQVEITSEKEPANYPVKAYRPAFLQTRWAEPIVHRRNRPDVESIRSAKITAELMDEERRQQHFKQAAND